MCIRDRIKMKLQTQNPPQKHFLVFRSAEQFEKYISDTQKVLVCINNKICDISSYISEHPGGDIIEEYNGFDISELFFDPQCHKHSLSALRILEKMQIGVFDEENSSEEDYLEISKENSIQIQTSH
eukprot:TRINITY_DN9326_c0_g1_i1.p2 TRINITY_DN9326_c0_g1~~TRINITY_DN9326_c0_g1_i1.p2  ORF type:complete len:126 (+),score=22.19 TRINITY_DN9326_c0_g1_i1:192-569(+)